MLLHSSHHSRRLALDKFKSVQQLVGEPIQKIVCSCRWCGENKSMHKLLSGSVVQESANSADAPNVEISFRRTMRNDSADLVLNCAEVA